MRVIEINVSAFGGLRDFHLDMSEGLNALHRPNGWGKSTLAVFVKAMLYGLPSKGGRGEDGERKRYLPWQGGVYGGSMSFESARGRFRVERFFGARESADSFSLYDLTTNLPSDAYSERLGEELFGIDADGFARTAFLSHSMAPKGESVSLSARLASLVEAAEDAGDYDAAAALLEKRSRFYRTTGQRGRIPELERELVREERRCEELLALERTLRDHRREIARLDESLAALEAEQERIHAQMQSAAQESGRAANRARYEALLGRRERIDARMRAIDRASGGKHPTDDMIARATRRVEKYARLCAREDPPAPEEKGGSAWCGIGIATAIAALASTVGAFLLPLLWSLAAVFAVASVLSLVTWRKRARRDRDARLAYATEMKNRENARNEAEEQAARALFAIGAPVGGGMEAIDAVSRREVEYRLLLREREELAEQIGRMEAEHRELLLDTTPLTDTEALARTERSLRAQLRTARERRAELAAAADQLEKQIEALPEAEAAVRSLREALAVAREKHGELLLTAQYLREAKESLSTRYLDRMRERVEAYLSALDAAAPETFPDASLALSVRTETGTHKLSHMSSGWQDLIGLCARLALSDVLFEGGETPILILDDPLITLDDAHLHAGKLLLARLCEKYQILYVYCHADRG